MSCIRSPLPSGLLSRLFFPTLYSRFCSANPSSEFYVLPSGFLTPQNLTSSLFPAFLGELGGPTADFANLGFSFISCGNSRLFPSRRDLVQTVQQVGGPVETREFLRAWSGFTSSLPTPPLTARHTMFRATKAKLRFSMVIVGDWWTCDEESSGEDIKGCCSSFGEITDCFQHKGRSGWGRWEVSRQS